MFSKEGFLVGRAASGDPALRAVLHPDCSSSLPPFGNNTSSFKTNAPMRRLLCAQEGGVEANRPDAWSVVLPVNTSSVQIECFRRAVDTRESIKSDQRERNNTEMELPAGPSSGRTRESQPVGQVQKDFSLQNTPPLAVCLNNSIHRFIWSPRDLVTGRVSG